MGKTLSVSQMEDNFGNILHGVVANGDRVLVEQGGETVAVVLPMGEYQQWPRDRK